MNRHIIRSLKYLVFISILYIGLVWLMSVTAYPEHIDLQMLLKAQLYSEQGLWLVTAFVILSLLYPLFGFMRRTIEGANIEDRVRIDNAMRVYGFEYVATEGDALIYKARGLFGRITYLFEDRIEVRAVAGGVELRGIRRAVARIAFQLSAYITNSRFEDKE
ncbi:MAG: hypothetical protein J6Q95_07485 [Alistipes sp.]|nr:hypothetical protein [Alistipes sp.]